jgi:hypothetical protein
MNGEDLATLRGYILRMRNMLEQVRALERIPPEADVDDVEKELRTLERDLGTFTEYVVIREAASWGARKNGAVARHPAPQWIRPGHRAPVSEAAGMRVKVYDQTGRFVGFRDA